MIHYFSGTGNSRFVAQQLASLTNDTASAITDETRHAAPEAEQDSMDVLGFVFPVYAWGLPRVMERFIRNFPLPSPRPSYIYMVCTCGDDIGRTDRLCSQLLRSRGLRLDAAWSVQMPNTYIALPGFDTDGTALVKQKINAASERTGHIASCIGRRECAVTDVCPGKAAWIKSYILRPLFNLFLTGDRHFRTSPDCTRCGKCVRACPMKNIVLDNRSGPTWNGRCADCLACYHICPVHAIAFGPFSKKKGQYLTRQQP